MPTYEYVCRACGHRFEKFEKISDEPTRECPECDEPSAERLISAGAGLVFKGSGFYATDYRKSAPPKEPVGGSDAEGGDRKESTVKKPPSKDSTEGKDE